MKEKGDAVIKIFCAKGYFPDLALFKCLMMTPLFCFIFLLGSLIHGGELTSAASLKLLSSVTLKTTSAQSQQLNGGWSLCKKANVVLS
jgi:hypothetical protein